MRAIKLKTEYLIEPVGIDIQKPLLMWNCDGGMKQTAYHINASLNGKTVWDSGKVRADAMRAEYPKELGSRQRVEWKVRLWDENDEPGDWSDTAFFETGLLSADDWKAKWVAGNYHVNKKKRYPVDCFKKAFTAIGVRKARLYVTACGLYEIKLNGQRVGNFVLAPGHTDYRRRIIPIIADVFSIRHTMSQTSFRAEQTRSPPNLPTDGTAAAAVRGGLEINTAHRPNCSFSLNFTTATARSRVFVRMRVGHGRMTDRFVLPTIRTARSSMPAKSLLMAGGQKS